MWLGILIRSQLRTSDSLISLVTNLSKKLPSPRNQRTNSLACASMASWTKGSKKSCPISSHSLLRNKYRPQLSTRWKKCRTLYLRNSLNCPTAQFKVAFPAKYRRHKIQIRISSSSSSKCYSPPKNKIRPRSELSNLLKKEMTRCLICCHLQLNRNCLRLLCLKISMTSQMGVNRTMMFLNCPWLRSRLKGSPETPSPSTLNHSPNARIHSVILVWAWRHPWGTCLVRGPC